MPFVHPIFRSFFQAGFECSTYKRADGKRLDLLASTDHDRLGREDHKRIQAIGIRTARVAARWHLIEQLPSQYNFDSLALTLDAASESGTEVLLDLLHFGWPDHVDVFSREFVSAFADFTYAAARFLRRRGDCNKIAPVNEISFLAWAGGDAAAINPHAVGRGWELKRNLVRAAAKSSRVLLEEIPNVRLISPEPVINIVGNPAIPGDDVEAENYRLAQYHAWDMISGQFEPELGGRPEFLDIIGVNFYERNQWVHNSKTALPRTDLRYRPFHEMLLEVWERYRRPIFVAETGTEDCVRAAWFNYVCDEVYTALALGIPIHGICLYPILNHPGWEDDRHCHNGLFDYAGSHGEREIHWPLAEAILRQQSRLDRSNHFYAPQPQHHRSDLFLPPALGIRLSTPTTPDEPLCPA
ncbi:MAG TPA: hypothetical protein VFB14_13005 [Bryobacteraceae bacterium]|nr:hypothetical protein [Bryobacteraceae bacterium]